MSPPRNPPSIAVTLAVKLIEYGVHRGLDGSHLFRVVGLTPASAGDPEQRIPIQSAYLLWAELLRSLNDPGIPIHIAEHFRLEDYQIMGFAIMTAKDGREAVQRVLRYSSLFTDSGHWEMDEGPEEATARFIREGELTLGHRAANEAAVGAFVHCFRRSSGDDFDPIRITFRHPAPCDVSAHQRFFRCPIEFNAADDSLTFPCRLFDTRPRDANPALSVFFARHAESLLPKVLTADETAARVRKTIARELTSGIPSMTTVAKELRMSERSLRRYLGGEGTSFRQAVEDVRRQRAEQLLRDKRISIGEIALFLGFSDISAFSRAFKRWRGTSPREFREQTT